MNKVKINTKADYLKELDVLGEEFLRTNELMELIVNGATLMSVSKDALRGIIRVILMGTATEVTALQSERDTLKKALELACEVVTCQTANSEQPGMSSNRLMEYFVQQAQEETPNAK